MIALLLTALIATVFLALGIILYVVYITVSKDGEKKINRCSTLTSGVVTKVIRKRISSSSGGSSGIAVYSYFPTYEYETGLGRVKVTSKVGVAKGKVKEGQKIDVYYNPSKSSETYVPQFSSSSVIKTFKYIGITMFAFAAIVMVSGIIIMIILN